MLKFKIDDIVCLTTGSGPMRVTNVFGNRLVECEWEGKEGRMYKHYFRPDSLLYYNEGREDIANFIMEDFKKDKNK